MNTVRRLLLRFFDRVGLLTPILIRANYTEIGVFGNVSFLDKEFAKEKNYKTLTSFERWLCKPLIAFEIARRKDAFRQASIEVLGEDSDDWGR